MRELMSYLPENYQSSLETVAFQSALQPEVDGLWEARDDLLAQLNPYTSTWGLEMWEDALGLPLGSGLESKLRRQQVVAKLQGRGTTTPTVLRNVAETLLGVDVTVVEIFDQYLVQLETAPGYQPAEGIDQLLAQLGDIMPAHLDWKLVIPTAIQIPVRAALGLRVGRSAPPMAAYEGGKN